MDELPPESLQYQLNRLSAAIGQLGKSVYASIEHVPLRVVRFIDFYRINRHWGATPLSAARIAWRLARYY